MIPEIHGRTVVSNRRTPTVAFGISAKDTTHLMTILRDTLYSDKIRAVLREYGANARDAHCDPRCPDKRDTPIEIHLPTELEPTLEIRDHGPGLSPDEIATVFTKYGASTKRESNETVGYLGIGSKAGFCYSDSFTVVSKNGGRCRTYVAVLDASEDGEIRLLDDSPCDENDTGLTIQIGVRSHDINEFTWKAKEVFQYFSPRPKINVELPPVKVNSALEAGKTAWLAVMGGVAYPIDLDQIGAHQYLRSSGGVVFFGIGELRVSASREALKYDDFTKQNLIAKLEAAIDEHVQSLLQQMAGSTQWEKRLKLRGMDIFGALLENITFAGVFSSKIQINNTSLRIKAKEIFVRPYTRIVFVDCNRSIKGYDSYPNDCWVRRRASKAGQEPQTYAQALDNLQAMIRSLKIEGIPVVMASELPWTRPASSTSQTPTHRGKCFVYNGLEHSRRLSSRWDPIEHVPGPEDVYVVLEKFRTDMYEQFRHDKTILNTFDIAPKIYGYRLSKKGNDKHPGMTYEEWRQGLYDRIVAKDPSVAKLIDAMAWKDYRHHDALAMNKVIEALGIDHPIGAAMAKIKTADNFMQKHSDKYGAVLMLAHRQRKFDEDGEQAELEAIIYETYPLTRDRFDVFLSFGAESWIEYVQAMDFKRNYKETT